MAKKTAGKGTTKKHLNLQNLRPWPKGTSGNPKGRPKEGESWAAIIKKIGDMTGTALAEYFSTYAPQFRKIGPVTMKEAVVARAYLALAFEPSGSLFNALADRAEGKVTQPIDVSWRDELAKRGINASDIFERLVNDFAARLDGTANPGGVAGGETPSAEPEAERGADRPSDDASSGAGGSPTGG